VEGNGRSRCGTGREEATDHESCRLGPLAPNLRQAPSP
jgi:hypothetical protein